MKQQVFIVPADASPQAQARCRRLSEELSLPLGEGQHDCPAPILTVGSELRVEFPRTSGQKKADQLAAEWSRLDVSSRAGAARRQPLFRAIRGKTRTAGLPRVLDGTAGLGEDAWLLSSLGHSVLAVEQHPAVFALLRDAWARTGVFSPWRTRRIRPIWAETGGLLRSMAGSTSLEHSVSGSLESVPRPDVIYLDPMFPGHGQRKTAERKPLRLLRQLVGDDRGEDPELLGLALEVARDRVVVKRPLKAPCYASRKWAPGHQVPGRSVRFDVYFPH